MLFVPRLIRQILLKNYTFIFEMSVGSYAVARNDTESSHGPLIWLPPMVTSCKISYNVQPGH